MAILNYTDLKADIIEFIFDNDQELITGQIEQDRMINIIDSTVNAISGGFVMQSLFGQKNYITPLDDRDYTPKKYVDDAISTIDLTGYLPLYAGSGKSLTGDLYLGGNGIFDIKGVYDASSLAAFEIGTGYRYLIDATGNDSNPIVDFSSIVTGFAINTQGVSGRYGKLHFDNITGSRDYQFPNGSGTIALTSDITALSAVYMPLSGGVFTGPVTLNANASSALQPVSLQQMNAALVGLWDDRGNFTPSGSYPSTGGSGVSGAILKGDIWTIHGLGVGVAGTMGGITVYDGDNVRALVDSPGSTDANWASIKGDFGYTPLSNTLVSAKIFVGNSSNVATGVSVTGDISITNTGVTAIGSGRVTNAMLAGSITASKLVGTDISTVGTITVGTWNGTAIADTYISSAAIWNAKVSSQWITTGSDIYYSTGNVMIGQASAPLTKLHVVETSTATLRGALFGQYSTDTLSSKVTTRKARGSYASPTTIVTADVLSNWTTAAYDGTNFLDAASIRTTSVGIIGTGRTPTKMEFMTMTDVSTGVLTVALTLDQNQNGVFAGTIAASNLSLSGNFATTGAFNPTFAIPRSTTWTLPNTASETLAGLGTAQTFSAVQTFGNDIQFASTKGIKDANGNYIISTPATIASAVNYIEISNNATTLNPSIISKGGDANINLVLSTKGASTTIAFQIGTVTKAAVFGSSFALTDGVNLTSGTTTGTKIGIATSQKFAFWNATPIVQPSGANQAAITDSTTGTASFTLSDVGIAFSQSAINNNFASLARQVNEMRNVLVNTGLMKGSA